MRGGRTHRGRKARFRGGREDFYNRNGDQEQMKESTLPTGAISGLPILQPPKIRRESSITESKIYSNWMSAI